ncbi:MAG: hypothetical protein J6S38_07250 [Erysipelotrichaceae bacterium]|nr:hypothetical protein [Erysipelotrichaceae bacterium]
MKITSFNPMIITSKADDLISLFEALGFASSHQKEDIDDRTDKSVRMKDENGFHVDIAQVDVIPQDLTTIRMNVRNFDEAYKLLCDHGFMIVQGGKITETGSSRSVMMVSPSGTAINLNYHYRDEDV